MSVTFGIEFLPTGKFTFKCFGEGFDAQRPFGPFDSYDEGLLAGSAHRMTCTECDIYGVHVTAQMDIGDEWDVNMSNSNAVLVMGVLGIDINPETGLCGSMKAVEFLNRAAAAVAVERAVGDRAARPSITTKSEGGPTVIDCGLPQDYVVDRLEQLVALAGEAQRLGRDITWG